MPAPEGGRFAMIVEFKAAPGKAAELRAALLALVAPTRAEDGCERYDLHVDAADEDALFFYEIWRDAAAHRAHDATPHIAHLRTVLPALLAAPVRIIFLKSVEPAAA